MESARPGTGRCTATRWPSLGAAAWWSLSLSLALTPAPAQQPDDATAASRITLAEQLQAQGNGEGATLMLWEAQTLLQQLPAAEREAAAKRIDALLPQVDPLAAERAAARTAAARRLIELAAGYRQKKWFPLAAERLDVAAGLDAAATQKERQALAAVYQLPATKVQKPLLVRSFVAAATAGWKLDGETLVGPAVLQASDFSFQLLDARAADNAIAFEAMLGNGDGGGGLLFGASAPNDLYTLGLYHKARNLYVVLSRCSGGKTEDLARAQGPNRIGSGFHTVEVTVRGPQVDVLIDRAITLTATTPTPAHGRLGFYAPGHSPTKQPLQFRGLAVAPLPEPARTPEQQIAAVQQLVTAELQAADKQLADKQVEAAVQRLRAAATRLGDLPSAARGELEAAVEQRLQKNDSLHGKGKKAVADTAAQFAALAARHRQDGRLRLARALLRDAAALDAGDEAHGRALVAVEAAIVDADRKSKAARPEDLLPPVTKGDLLPEWFTGGRLLFEGDPSWNVLGDHAEVTLTSHRWSGMLPRQHRGLGGRARVHVQLPQTGVAAGFLFDANSTVDVGFACLVRSDLNLFLDVNRFYQGTWKRHLHLLLPAPAWRLQGWFELEVECNEAGVVARALGTEAKVPRKDLGNLGPIGLGVSDLGKDRLVVDLRGFQLVQ